jgi:ABC-type nickel/cobalt efflux system permease component RcnA
MDASLAGALGLGLLLGLRHAMDADHVATVSALVSRERSLARSCLLGAFWGAGHTVALLAAGVGVIVFKLSISAEVEKGLETGVAALLMLLGGHVLLRSLGALTLHRHPHAHQGHSHSHLHLHIGADDSAGHVHLLRIGRRPFLVGLLHGLAGSAALMLLVLTTIPSPLGGLVYIVVFGLGSTAGMLVLSGVIGIPFAVAAGRSEAVRATIQAVAGAASLILGVIMASELWQA